MENAIRDFTKAVGLHPLVGFGMFAIDWMMFGGELITAELGLILTVPVGIALGIGSSMIQYRSYDKGDRMMALGKGILVGVLTAIPTALPSILTLGGALAGTTYKLLGSGEDEQAPRKSKTADDVIDGEVID